MNKNDKASISLKKIVCISIVLIFLLGIGVMAGNVKVNNVKIILSSGYEMSVLTTKTTIKDILDENHIILLDDEKVTPSYDDELSDNKTIVITKKDETIIDDFDPQEIETYIGMIVINSKEDIPLLVETLSPYFDIQRHQTGCSFDLTLKGVSKAVGIQKLVEALHKDIKATIAFGDGRNDLEMLETVGTGVAMDNAVPEAKFVADEICPDVNDDGITTWLKERDFI